MSCDAALSIGKDKLHPKSERTIERLLGIIGGKNGLFAIKGTEDIRRIKLGMEVIVAGRQLFLTEKATDALRNLAALLKEILLPNPHISSEDIWKAVIKEAKHSLQEQVWQSGSQFFSNVISRLQEKMADFTLAADFEGIEISGLEEIDLGRVKIVKSNPELLRGFAGIGLSEKRCQDLLKYKIWLMGIYQGTLTAAQEQFEVDAAMTSGLLGIVATIHYEHGFSETRPVVHVNSLDPGRPCTVLYWRDGFDNPGVQTSWARGQNIKVNPGLIDYLEKECNLKRIIDILQGTTRNEVEEAIARSVYWFAQAQRDAERVMQYVKLWSCIESFFGFLSEGMTENNAMGVASVLVFGGYQIAPLDNYDIVKQKLKKFYAQRSKAIHRAEHRHVDASDLKELSYWAAWCIITFVSFSERNYSTLKQVWEDVKRLDDIASAEKNS